MTLGELIASARLQASDTVIPYLWSDAEWTNYVNDAEREACRRARLIVDSDTAEICSLSLTASTKTIALDPRVLFIRRAKVSGDVLPLHPVSVRNLDRGRPGWEDEEGAPKAYITDMDTGKFRPFPTPDADMTVKLSVCRLPLQNMAAQDDEPEIHARFHDSLIFWMLYQAYSKPDSETMDKQMAESNLALFEQEFGKKSAAIDEEWIARQHGFTEDEGVY